MVPPLGPPPFAISSLVHNCASITVKPSQHSGGAEVVEPGGGGAVGVVDVVVMQLLLTLNVLPPYVTHEREGSQGCVPAVVTELYPKFWLPPIPQPPHMEKPGAAHAAALVNIHLFNPLSYQIINFKPLIHGGLEALFQYWGCPPHVDVGQNSVQVSTFIQGIAFGSADSYQFSTQNVAGLHVVVVVVVVVVVATHSQQTQSPFASCQGNIQPD